MSIARFRPLCLAMAAAFAAPLAAQEVTLRNTSDQPWCLRELRGPHQSHLPAPLNFALAAESSTVLRAEDLGDRALNLVDHTGNSVCQLCFTPSTGTDSGPSVRIQADWGEEEYTQEVVQQVSGTEVWIVASAVPVMEQSIEDNSMTQYNIYRQAKQEGQRAAAAGSMLTMGGYALFTTPPSPGASNSTAAAFTD